MSERALEKKVIVIVGGTTGLGLSAAKACVNAGARVVVVGRKPESLDSALAALGRTARGVEGDACEPATAERAVEAAVREHGGFDGLYHVAGGSGRSMGDGPLHEIPDGAWDATLRLNLTPLFYSNRAAVRQLLRQGTPGSIVNIGSILGLSPSPRYFATHAYAAAKSAVIGMTKAAASYYAPRGIRFNVVAPALVDTPMARRTAGDREILEFIRTKQPLDGGRIGRPEDLDAAVVYLLSDGSRFVTGQVLAIDGGWSVSEGQYPTEKAT
jgi:NAD(P)-dependent dehydrogenase (short-subunit alcohol dehydrogenase family)